MTDKPHVARKNIYLTERALNRLGPGDSLSGRITTVIDRYSELCRRSRPQDKFSETEQKAILDATMSWAADPAATIFGGVALELTDAADDGLAQKWGVDLTDLIAKVEALSIGDQIALVDWIERERERRSAS